MFAFIQIIEPIRVSIIYPELFIIAGFSLFITVSIYLLARTFFWGILASAALHIREVTMEESKKRMDIKRDKITLMLRVHHGCTNFFEKSHKKLKFLVGSGRNHFYSLILYGVIFFIIVLILNDVYPILIL